jgi:hypothetical protein
LRQLQGLKENCFDETLASDYILDLKEIAKTNSNEIEFGAKIWSKTKGENPLSFQHSAFTQSSSCSHL